MVNSYGSGSLLPLPHVGSLFLHSFCPGLRRTTVLVSLRPTRLTFFYRRPLLQLESWTKDSLKSGVSPMPSQMVV